MMEEKNLVRNMTIYDHIIKNILGQKGKSNREISREIASYIMSLDLPQEDKDHIAAAFLLVTSTINKDKSPEVKNFIQQYL